MAAIKFPKLTNEGPELEVLIRRLAECPADFTAEPRIGAAGQVHVAAVVSDLLVDLGGAPLGAKGAAPFSGKTGKQPRNRLSLILIAAWLLHDPWFTNRREFAANAKKLLETGLDEIAGLVPAKNCITDPDNREELARLCLDALLLRPAGETRTQAQDRLATLNSAERQRVIKAAQAAEARAREVQAAMQAQRARETADKMTRE